MKAKAIHELIHDRLLSNIKNLKAQFDEPKRIRRFFVDDLLPEDIALELQKEFPESKEMHLYSNLAEKKWVSADMDRFNPLLKTAIFAFQHPDVVKSVSEIVGRDHLVADPKLYAGGLTLMTKGHFLNPHIDHSHDKSQQLWRNLNLLYYVGKNSESGKGGELELWHDGVRAQPEVIPTVFNRLVVMETHQHAFHSVAPIKGDYVRPCISNYFFGETPMDQQERYHVTSFRGRPDQPLKDACLIVDNKLRGVARRMFPKGLKKSKQVYRKLP